MQRISFDSVCDKLPDSWNCKRGRMCVAPATLQIFCIRDSFFICSNLSTPTSSAATLLRCHAIDSGICHLLFPPFFFVFCLLAASAACLRVRSANVFDLMPQCGMTVMPEFYSALFFHSLCTFSLLLSLGTLHFHFLYTATWRSENHGINDYASNSVEHNKKKKQKKNLKIKMKMMLQRNCRHPAVRKPAQKADRLKALVSRAPAINVKNRISLLQCGPQAEPWLCAVLRSTERCMLTEGESTRGAKHKAFAILKHVSKRYCQQPHRCGKEIRF